MVSEDMSPLNGWVDDLSAEIEVEAQELSEPLMDHPTQVNRDVSTPATSTSSSTSSGVCKWRYCDYNGTFDDLVDHIREIHVKLQPYLPDCLNEVMFPSPPSTSSNDSIRPSCSSNNDKSTYVCLWEGCKVFNIPSQKRSWLDRHILQHSGDKPFKCIVQDCGERFKSQATLERHVNSHFNSMAKDVHVCLNSDGSSEHGSDDLSRVIMRTKGSSSNQGSNSVGSTPNKMAKKKKTTRRKIVVRGSGDDFFDASVMEVIQYRLFQIQQKTGLRSVKNVSLESTVST